MNTTHHHLSQSHFYQRHFTLENQHYRYFSLTQAEEAGLGTFSKLPKSLKILLENLLRHLDGKTVQLADIQALGKWLEHKTIDHEIAFRPARVLMQDFTGVPAIVDLATLRDTLQEQGADPKKVNPLIPVDLVIDHSVQVDKFNSEEAYRFNVAREYERNLERYRLLRWGQLAFTNFRVVPPGTGICHQVNLEYLASVVFQNHGQNKESIDLYPDTVVGTDSHTTMVNGLGVLGWGVGGIEAEACMLGQEITMLIPDVIGVHCIGALQEGITATDLVLTITEILRKKGVVGKFVEFHGEGLRHLSLADRATISNMSPEFGATATFFPIDDITLEYLQLTGRSDQQIALCKHYAKEQGLWHDPLHPPEFTENMTLDLSQITPCIAGPKRPQDKVALAAVPQQHQQLIIQNKREAQQNSTFQVKQEDFSLKHGDVVIAAITSCTNTSNPTVLIAAGLLAKKAIEKGLKVKPWVKTSFAPGSKVVTAYLEKAGLQTYLNQLGFGLVGYGCTTCIGNSGPLPEKISEAIRENDVIVSAVLSGNRNFEGRIHPQVKANWLASPPLVIGFALLGNTRENIQNTPLGNDKEGIPVFLKDIWPSQKEIEQLLSQVTAELFRTQYQSVFLGDETWQQIEVQPSLTYEWHQDSTYVRRPPFFDPQYQKFIGKEIKNAKILAVFGDSITTDHISPAGNIKENSPSGHYLKQHQVSTFDFNSYGARRGNHEVMMRGTFANIRIKNELLENVEGGFTSYQPSGEVLPIFDASIKYRDAGIPLVIFAGKEYGSGSSRDWAAKGPLLLGVTAVIAESFERIHRSNLIGMGILPLELRENLTRKELKLTGKESINILGLSPQLSVRAALILSIVRENGQEERFPVRCRIDTQNELAYYFSGGILPFIAKKLASE